MTGSTRRRYVATGGTIRVVRVRQNGCDQGTSGAMVGAWSDAFARIVCYPSWVGRLNLVGYAGGTSIGRDGIVASASYGMSRYGRLTGFSRVLSVVDRSYWRPGSEYKNSFPRGPKPRPARSSARDDYSTLVLSIVREHRYHDGDDYDDGDHEDHDGNWISGRIEVPCAPHVRTSITHTLQHAALNQCKVTRAA